MRAARPSVICDRVRAQISIELDGELSQLERAMLAAHLGRCADCRAYELDVTAFTRVVREAPLERMEGRLVVRPPRRFSVLRLPPAVAAGLAIAVVGLGSQLAVYQPRERARSPLAAPTRFPTQGELERELALLELATGASLGDGARETVK